MSLSHTASALLSVVEYGRKVALPDALSSSEDPREWSTPPESVPLGPIRYLIANLHAAPGNFSPHALGEFRAALQAGLAEPHKIDWVKLLTLAEPILLKLLPVVFSGLVG
jgi:hypothetical protein